MSLNEFIATLEDIIGKKAIIDQYPMQPGDVEITYADVTRAQEDFGYEPKTPFAEGLRRFVEWYRENRL